jgi:hypothetical protein
MREIVRQLDGTSISPRAMEALEMRAVRIFRC